MTNSVLVIDDDQNMRWVLQRALGQSGFDVIVAPTGEAGLVSLVQNKVDVVLLDLKMPGMDGLGALRRIRQLKPDLPVILLTAYASVPTAVEAMRLGAAEYLRKPFDVEEVRFALAKALERAQMAHEIQRLNAEVKERYSFDHLVGQSLATADLRDRMSKAVESDLNVLVVGEKGSGKTVVAKSILHSSSPPEASLVEIRSNLLAERAIRKELAGADAWAESTAILIEDADLLSPQLQKEIASALPQAGPRILSTATDENKIADELLEKTVDIIIKVPALRDRLDDIPLLAAHFLEGKATLESRALRVLQHYSWPGNIAELRAVLSTAATLADGTIELSHLPAYIVKEMPSVNEPQFKLPQKGISLEEVEKQLLVQALEQAHGNKTKAAELLGLTRHTLLYRLEKYGLV